jgi:RimJ/RimL family protein N-acetyltransferase
MTDADADHLYLLNSSANVMKYLGGEPTLSSREQAVQILQSKILPQYSLYGVGRLAVLLKESGSFIGYCGLKYLPEAAEYDLGYRFLEEYWGQGYATEAASAVLEYGRSHLKGKRIVGKVFLENTASIRVLEKIGMQFEGHQPYGEGMVAVYAA